MIIIWDFDTYMGQINSTYPYNFKESSFEEERHNISCILDALDEYKIKAVFAVVALPCENLTYLPCFKELIYEISSRGHEIASHSWRHENFAKITLEQADRSLKRSKQILESCLNLNIQQSICGFIPPHNRPMSWKRKFRLHKGDSFLASGYCNDIEALLLLLRKNNYKWTRISGHSIFFKLFGLKKNHEVFTRNSITIFDGHTCGFSSISIRTKVVSAHPLMWGRKNNAESYVYFKKALSEGAISPDSIELPMHKFV